MVAQLKQLFGRDFIGPSELQGLSWPIELGALETPEIAFSEAQLKQAAGSHILIFTPPQYATGAPITLNSLRQVFGVDPAAEPCMYNQDWYLKEDFAGKTSLDGHWHLVRRAVREDARGMQPSDIERGLRGERFPSAVTCAFTFFASWYTTGQKLWVNDFVWCCDRDGNGDRIYVGRYEDPAGLSKNGFNVHRHLALRAAYSAAPEIATHD